MDKSEYEKIAQEQIKLWEKANNAYHFDDFVLYEKDIVNKIKSEFKVRSCFDAEYWKKKTSLEFSVLCILNDIIISYDYFLFRSGNLQNDSKVFVDYLLSVTKRHNLEREADKIKFCFLVEGETENVKLQYLSLNFEMSVIEALISNYSFRDYNKLKLHAVEMKEATKKKLNIGKYSVKKSFEAAFNFRFKKLGKTKKSDELKLLALLYYFDKIGIPIDEEECRCIFICDILKNKKLENRNQGFYNVIPAEVAIDVELFKNEIIKHIELEKIFKINERTRFLYSFFNKKSEYINYKLIDDSELTHDQIKNELLRVKGLFCKINKCIEKINNTYYEEDLFEFIFIRYQKYIFECEREESFETLEFILKTKAPNTSPFFEIYKDDKMRYFCIELRYIDIYIDRYAEDISTFVLGKTNAKWVISRKIMIHSLIELMKRFNRTINFESIELTILLSMFQVIKEVEENNYNYKNNYRNYKGNKKISILSKLKEMSDNTKKVEKVFDYIWIGLLKKWFMHNECKYELWKLARENENIFNKLICKIAGLNNLESIDTVISAINIELNFPMKYSIIHYNKLIEKNIYEKTGYKIVINDFKIYGYFDYEEFLKEFIEIVSQLIYCYERDKNDNEKEIYHMKLRELSIKVEQNYNEKIFNILEIRIICGYDYDKYKRISDLGFNSVTISAFNF